MDPTEIPHLEEARSLRDLGFFNDANHLFSLALAQHPDKFLLSLEAAGCKLSQGLVGDAGTMVSEADARLDRASPGLNPLHVAVLDVFHAFTTYVKTAKFKEPLQRALACYVAHGLGKEVGDFDKHTALNLTVNKVIITFTYHSLLAMAAIMGFPVDKSLPCMTAEFQSSLVRHLLAEKRYADAIKVAKLCDYSEEPVDGIAMVKAVLAEDSLSNLERAEMLWECGDRMHLTSSDSAWQNCLSTAAELYTKAGHASGALEMRIDKIRHAWDQSRPIDEYTAELWQIMADMERIGNWSGANRCLMAITEINTGDYRIPPEALQVRIEEELTRLTEICGRNVGSMGASIYKVLEWQSRKSRGALGLDYLEKLYEKVKDCDSPTIISTILTAMHDAYTAIGQEDKALDCLRRRPELLPRELQAILGIDPFQQALIAATEAKDTETELALLRAELKEVQAIMRRAPKVLARDTEVERLANICHYYLTQHAFRGHEQVQKLIDCVEPVLLEGCEGLGAWRATVWRAKALQARSLLIQTRCPQAKTMEELLSCVAEATQYYQQSVDLFNASERPQDWRAASAKALLANNLKLLWSLKGKPAASEDFTRAATLYAEALGSGPVATQKAICISLLRHWVDGIDAKVEVDAAVFGTSSAYEMAIKWANEADRLETIQRNDLSALPRERAVLAKQDLTAKRNPKDDFCTLGFLLHDSVDDMVGAWNWLAKSKARSLSDMLALGINIPKTLQHQIESDAELVRMCETEQALAQQLSKADEDQLFLLRIKMDAHRAEMKKRPILQQLLSLREGQPTTLERLQSISAQQGTTSTRKIICVDWLVFSGLFFALVITPAGLEVIATGVSTADVAAWKAQYLNSVASTGQQHPLDDNKAEPLQKLSKLIQPLLKLADQGDMLWGNPTCGLRPMLQTSLCSILASPIGYELLSFRSQEASHNAVLPQGGVRAAWEGKISHFRTQGKISNCESIHQPSKTREDSHPKTATKSLPVQYDIIVFCPTGVLHGVPLHAATLEETSTKTLLERNPVVYTASMTAFEQSVSHETERASGTAPARAATSPPTDDAPPTLSDLISRSYVAVYERTETAPLDELQAKQRDAIYDAVRGVAARYSTTTTGTTKVTLGGAATRDALVSAFEADYMYFFGHCKSGAGATANMLLQGLVLGNTNNNTPSSSQDPPDEMFTASDVFTITINTSCLTLLACGSAHEAHTAQGDEPLGLVSAMLCAGATSVIGTMWKVQVGTARVFTEVLDRNLDGGRAGDGARLVDLAVAVQRAALRLKTRQEGGTRHPYHWAAFVLNGCWFVAR
ncbi:CHAT domain-containing protein [Podospora conica]|nr:CHAT domain-containing protein [Schizothecium conicum]